MCPLQGLFIFPAIFFLGYAIFGIITGRLFSKGGWFYREDSPLLFYLVVAISIGFSVVCFHESYSTPKIPKYANQPDWGTAIIFALFAITIGVVLIYTIRSQNKK